MNTENTAKNVAKKFGFIEGTKNFNIVVKIFCEGAEYGNKIKQEEESKKAIDFALWLWNTDEFFHSSKDEWFCEKEDSIEWGRESFSTSDLYTIWEKRNNL